MTISDEFQAQIRSGNIVEALTMAIGGAIELEITTWVASSQSNTDEQSAGNRIRTRISIVDGEIDNEVGSKFIGIGPYTELRELHLQQVQQGREIIQRNLENLQQMFIVLSSTISQLPQGTLPQTEDHPLLLSDDQDNL